MTPSPRQTGRPRFWSGGERTNATDVGLASLLFLALTALYGATVQTRMHGDGPGLGTYFAEPRFESTYNWAYLDLCRATAFVFPWLGEGDPIAPMKILGVLAGAAAGALTYLFARGFAATRAQALLGALLLAVAPAAWFYATSVEVHVVHFAAVALAGCVTLYAPWRLPGVALPLVVLSMPVLFFTHQSGAFLGPGFVLLVQYARSRAARPFPWWVLLLVVAPLLFFALLACHGYTNFLRLGRWTLSSELNLAQIQIHGAATPHWSLRMLVEGWAVPLGLLIPTALLGLLAAVRRRWLAALTLLLLIVPSTVFFLWWGLPERGGYVLALGPFYAAAAALAMRVPGGPGWAGGVALLSIQAAAGFLGVHLYDRGFDPAERVRVVRAALPRGGTVVSFRELTPRIEVWLDDVQEVLGAPVMSEYHVHMRKAYGEELRAEDLAEGFARDVMKLGVDHALAQGEPVVIDASYRRLYDVPVVAFRRPYLEAVERMLDEGYDVEELWHPDWTLLRVRPR